MPTSETILIVDDYPEALEVWGLYLRAAGFTVLTAGDGRTALARATGELPDLVVLDIELPGLSGDQVSRTLRAHPETSDIPQIAATGVAGTGRLSQVRLAGFDLVLHKPCDPDLLVAEVRRLLARRRSPRALGTPNATNGGGPV
jgi:CheY-like chemotaxis protein